MPILGYAVLANGQVSLQECDIVKVRVKIGCLLGALFCSVVSSAGEGVIRPSDFVLSIDEDLSRSFCLANEGPESVIDGKSSTSYVNRGGRGSGLIVTPRSGAVRLRSFQLTTGAGNVLSDPTLVAVYGTNDDLESVNHSRGREEDWKFLVQTPVDLPCEREAEDGIFSILNFEEFRSYKFLFLEVRGGMGLPVDVGEIRGWDRFSGRGREVIGSGDQILAVHDLEAASVSPVGESVENLFDGDVKTKYTNRGHLNSGFIVTPSVGPTVVGSFRVVTADDEPNGDPVAWELYGTNDIIESGNHSQGLDETWEMIEAGALQLMDRRGAELPRVYFENSEEYLSYTFVVRGVRGGREVVDVMQMAEFQLFEVEPEVEIVSVTVHLEEGLVTLGWRAPVGALYRIESSGDLLDWDVVVADGLDPNLDAIYSFPLRDGGERYYRLCLSQ